MDPITSDLAGHEVLTEALRAVDQRHGGAGLLAIADFIASLPPTATIVWVEESKAPPGRQSPQWRWAAMIGKVARTMASRHEPQSSGHQTKVG